MDFIVEQLQIMQRLHSLEPKPVPQTGHQMIGRLPRTRLERGTTTGIQHQRRLLFQELYRYAADY